MKPGIPPSWRRQRPGDWGTRTDTSGRRLQDEFDEAGHPAILAPSTAWVWGDSDGYTTPNSEAARSAGTPAVKTHLTPLRVKNVTRRRRRRPRRAGDCRTSSMKPGIPPSWRRQRPGDWGDSDGYIARDGKNAGLDDRSSGSAEGSRVRGRARWNEVKIKFTALRATHASKTLGSGAKPRSYIPQETQVRISPEQHTCVTRMGLDQTPLIIHHISPNI
jgi:hypothetical protein